MFNDKRFIKVLAGLQIALVVIALAIVTQWLGKGCKRKAVVRSSQVVVQPTRSVAGPFDSAMDFLHALDKFQPNQARLQIIYLLREWSREQKDSVEWIADPMIRRLPARFRDAISDERLSSSEFEQYDAMVLQEAAWLRDVAQSVAARPLTESRIGDWLEDAMGAQRLTQDQANELAIVYQLFDWTVRNIQLDDELEDRDVLGGQRERSRRAADAPRFIYDPGECLLLGHGDWLERSRVFVLLARQMGIPVVMLIAEDDESDRVKTWLPAALIGEDLYLFDPLLGLPMPGQGGAPLGRLADYLDDPGLLSAVSVDGYRYRILPDDLGRLTAAVDATPAHLSQRMELVESRLQGARKMVLTSKPTPLAVTLRACRGINQVEIWTFPYQGYLFRQQLNADATSGAELRQFLAEEQVPFNQLGPILQGRLLQFRGYYRGDEDAPGATQLLMDARMPDKEIARFDLELEQQPEGSTLLQNLPDDPQQRRLAYDQVRRVGKARVIRMKNLATYWLGIMAFEKGDYEVAVNYFQRRVLEGPHDTPWRQGATYNLARAYEAIGLRDQNREAVEKAVQLYEADENTPQRAGNLLRARILRTFVAERL